MNGDCLHIVIMRDRKKAFWRCQSCDEELNVSPIETLKPTGFGEVACNACAWRHPVNACPCPCHNGEKPLSPETFKKMVDEQIGCFNQCHCGEKMTRTFPPRCPKCEPTSDTYTKKEIDDRFDYIVDRIIGGKYAENFYKRFPAQP